MEVFRSEIKTGLLILAAFILLLTGIFITSNIESLWDDKKALVLLFPYADGITRGSPVWYAGLEVGEVTDLQIAHDRQDRIAVTVRIEPDARVCQDSKIYIRSLGMMGSKYVEITPGSTEALALQPGETLEGESPASLSEVIETGQQVAARLVELIQETQSLVHEVRADASLKETFQNANAFVLDLREQGKELKPLIGKLSKFADSLNATGQHLKKVSNEGGTELTAFLKELRETNQGLQKRLDAMENQISKTLEQIHKGFYEAEGCVRDVRSLVTSNEADISSLLRHLETTSRHLEALSEDLRANPWKVIWKEDGTYNALNPVGTEQWRDKGRIGPHGKE